MKVSFEVDVCEVSIVSCLCALSATLSAPAKKKVTYTELKFKKVP